MMGIARVVSLVAMGAVIAPCFLYFGGMVELNVVKWAALAGTIGWFIATPLWMGRKPPSVIEKVDAEQVRI